MAEKSFFEKAMIASAAYDLKVAQQRQEKGFAEQKERDEKALKFAKETAAKNSFDAMIARNDSERATRLSNERMEELARAANASAARDRDVLISLERRKLEIAQLDFDLRHPAVAAARKEAERLEIEAVRAKAQAVIDAREAQAEQDRLKAEEARLKVEEADRQAKIAWIAGAPARAQAAKEAKELAKNQALALEAQTYQEALDKEKAEWNELIKNIWVGCVCVPVATLSYLLATTQEWKFRVLYAVMLLATIGFGRRKSWKGKELGIVIAISASVFFRMIYHVYLK